MNLTDLYQSNFSFQSLPFSEALTLISFAVCLGLLGSYISVRQHIKKIEPNAD
jgi:cell division transport system permease protein